MKLLFKSYLNGWWMTGLFGKRKDLYWFFGFSRAATTNEQTLIRSILEDNHADSDAAIWKKGGKWYVTENKR